MSYTNANTTLLPIQRVRTDAPELQSRASLDPVTVKEYLFTLESGADLPPVVVYFDGTHYWLASGFHRLSAYQLAKRSSIPAEVRQGTRRDAFVLCSVRSNVTHGLRRTEADKRRVVNLLLDDDQWGKRSSEEIADHLKLPASFVLAMRQERVAAPVLPYPGTAAVGEEEEVVTDGGEDSTPTRVRAVDRLSEELTEDDVALLERQVERSAHKLLRQCGKLGVDPHEALNRYGLPKEKKGAAG